jgi:hypothetical protein
MRHDPARIADTRAWFVKAANDLRGVDVDLAAAPPLLGDALFHCQQAVEKAVKAFLPGTTCGSGRRTICGRWAHRRWRWILPWRISSGTPPL